MRAKRREGTWGAVSVVAVALLGAGCASNEGEGVTQNGATARDASAERSPPPDVLVSSGGSGGATSGADAMAVGGAVGTGGTAGGAAGAAGALPYAAGRCAEGLPGPGLVNVPSPMGTYCIDATEVTRGQYQEFVNARYNRQFVAQAPACDGGFLAGTNFPCDDVVLPSCEGNVYEPTERLTAPDGSDRGCTWWLSGMDDYPINCVDWCDAAGYCEWAGKRLCGLAGPANLELVLACKGGWDGADWSIGAYSVPGRNELSACNFSHDDPYEGLAPVGALKTCEGGYPGLFDLKGNVSEFSACSYIDGRCRSYGGAFTSQYVNVPDLPGQTDCNSSDGGDETRVGHTVGFRCCADALHEAP